jgi:hypothetical protein
MGVWQGVAMDSLKFHLSLPCPTLLRSVGGPTLKWPYGHFMGGPPAAVFYPFGHPMPYAFGLAFGRKKAGSKKRFSSKVFSSGRRQIKTFFDFNLGSGEKVPKITRVKRKSVEKTQALIV